MKRLADDIHQITGFPPNGINAYLAGDVLFDAGSRQWSKKLLKALAGRTVTAHALTHAHADHQGASHAVCERLGIPLWAPAGDADAVEDPRLIAERQPSNPLAQAFVKMFVGPPHPVARRLQDGDDVGGFRVIDAPGHSKGHVVFFRERDRTLILGDVVNNMHVLTGIPGLRLPMDPLTPDPATNRASARKLADLEPRLVLFGHGAPLRDTKKFVEFCRSL
jgi:hydroxyacylglutathione hydrolase